MSKLSIIIPAMNEEETLESVIKELKKLNPFEIIVIVNGSTDNTKQIAESLECKVIEYKHPLGHDIGRAVGAYFATEDILLFLDGDIVIPYKELIPLIKAIEEGHDIALNDLTSIIEMKQRPHSVTVVKKILNDLFGYSDLTINSLVAIPHAISMKALKKIEWYNLSTPPLAQAIAMREKLSIVAPCFIDVINRNKIRPEIHIVQSQDSPYCSIENIIFGDHLTAVHFLIEEMGKRGGYQDFRNRLFVENLEVVPKLKKVKRSAVIIDEENKSYDQIISLIQSLQNAGSEEIFVISSDPDTRKMNQIILTGAKFVPILEYLGPFVSRSVGAALSGGESVLFINTDSSFRKENFEAFFQEIEKGADTALLDVSHYLDTVHPIDLISATQYFLNISIKKPHLKNCGLTHAPHALSRKVLDRIGYSSLMIPPLAYMKIIENNFSLVTVKHQQKAFNTQEDFVKEVHLGDHIEALANYLLKTDKRGHFSNGQRNFTELDNLR